MSRFLRSDLESSSKRGRQKTPPEIRAAGWQHVDDWCVETGHSRRTAWNRCVEGAQARYIGGALFVKPESAVEHLERNARGGNRSVAR